MKQARDAAEGSTCRLLATVILFCVFDDFERLNFALGKNITSLASWLEYLATNEQLHVQMVPLFAYKIPADPVRNRTRVRIVVLVF